MQSTSHKINRWDRKLHESLKSWQPDGDDAFDMVRAGHLLNRTGFGGLPQEIEAVQALGVAGAVDALLDFPDAPADEQSRVDVPDETMLADIPLSDSDRRAAVLRLQRSAPEEESTTAVQVERQKWRGASVRHMRECTRWWLDRMVHGPYPLQEKLVLFWHGHFTSSFRDDNEGSWRMWNQNELLRTHAAGNFKTFVGRITRDPAMLKYLNNDRNVNRSPNENFARELMELFTLGIGKFTGANYTEDDIKQAARALTGWTHDGTQFTFRQRLHDIGEKSVFGSSGKFGGDELVDLLMQHPATAPHIGGKLFEFFVGTPADDEVRASLGRVLINANYELRPLLRVILRSQAFFDPERVGANIKSPIQLLVGTCRLLDVSLPDQRRLTSDLEKLGQVPFAPPNVKGWPGQFDGRRWINTATLLTRYNLGVTLAGQSKFDIPSDATSSDLVDYWLGRLIPRPVDAAKRRRLAATVGERPTQASLSDMVKLIVSMPEYQLC